MTNSTKYQLLGAMVPVITAFIAGSHIQNYFSHIGVTLGDISTYTSLVSVVQIIVMIINIYVIDRIKRIARMLVWLVAGSAIGCSMVIPFCISHAFNASTVFVYAGATSLVINIFMGLYNVLSFKFAYIAIDMSTYTKVTNNTSIINGMLAIAIGITVSWAAGIWDFGYVLAIGLLLCVIIGVLCIFFIVTIRPVEKTDNFQDTEKGIFYFSMLKKREYTYFYIPNLIRGMAMSAINVMPLIFIKNISSNPGDVSMLANIMSVSAIAGCFLYRFADRRVKTSVVYFVSSVIMFIFMPLLLVGYSKLVFYISYFVLGLFYNINAVAAAVYPAEYVEYSHIGAYTSVRLIILTLGQAVGAYVIGLVIDSVPSLAILCVCAFLQLASGIAFRQFKKEKTDAMPRPDKEVILKNMKI